MENGNVGTRYITSLFPLISTAMISRVSQSENHNRPSCQRGDSTNARPVSRVCASRFEDDITNLPINGWSIHAFRPTARRHEAGKKSNNHREHRRGEAIRSKRKRSSTDHDDHEPYGRERRQTRTNAQ